MTTLPRAARRALATLSMLFAVAALSLGGWYAFSPVLTVRAMQAALVTGDAPALAQRVDFPALRASLKTELRARLAAEAAASPPMSLKAVGLALAVDFVEPMVDATVTPEALGIALSGWSSAREIAPSAGVSALALLATPAFTIERDGFDRFSLRPDEGGAASARLLFRRDGLGWMLAGVALPPPAGVEAPDPAVRVPAVRAPAASSAG